MWVARIPRRFRRPCDKIAASVRGPVEDAVLRFFVEVEVLTRGRRVYAAGLAKNVVCCRKLGDDCTVVMAVSFSEFLFRGKHIRIV